MTKGNVAGTVVTVLIVATTALSTVNSHASQVENIENEQYNNEVVENNTIEYSEEIKNSMAEMLNDFKQYELDLEEIKTTSRGSIELESEQVVETLSLTDKVEELEDIKEDTDDIPEYLDDCKEELLEIREKAKDVDDDYNERKVKLSKRNYGLVRKLVAGEAGNQGIIGQMLVAQTIRDNMIDSDEYDTSAIIKAYRYSGSTSSFGDTPEVVDSCERAVRYIFEDGGYVVKHRLMYFYAPKYVKNNHSGFHESQNHVVTYKGHKFFDRKAK